ncbi:MAG: polysulfide reductase NrfD [Caldilineaceae bacterium]|nr:polysulfide reductase NrfD [Caldilineaceae bacterium]
MTIQHQTLSSPVESLNLRWQDWLVGVLAFLTFAGLVAGIGRLLMGMGATTQLNDSYSWGIWIGFDFSMIAFAGAGFTIAAVVHIFHLERFHSALRPALLTGLLGYVAVLLLLVLDLGRPDRFYHFLLYFNMHSPLFEISWCVLLYSTVLMIEVSPDILRRLPWRWPLRVVGWLMLPVTIIGVTLSTLHQSTLGTLYLNMPHRLHALWYTPVLPVLFYVSSIMAGLSLGALGYRFAKRVRGEPENKAIANGLVTGAVVLGAVYAIAKFVEIVVAGEVGLLASNMGMLWLGELLLGVGLPVLLWSVPAWRRLDAVQWLTPILIAASVLLNRFDATLFAQVLPAGAASYSPHILEWISTIGILAGAFLAWMLAVRFLLPKSEHHA